ncbi:MAG: hypothetical protein SGI72_03135 [Planctomycetota bacterium]|nr:hypothetical protein [Planctomycetota bacterium]
MSERSWGEADTAPPPKKKTIPTWLWFCGGGCLLAVVGAIIAATLIASYFKDVGNPEVQWPKVAEILPFDERPPELDLKGGGGFMGLEGYVFDDSRGYAAILMVFPLGQRADRDELMDPTKDGGVMGVGSRKDATASKLKIQGREVSVLRFHQMSDTSTGSKGMPRAGAGPSALIDLTKEGASKFVILQLVSLHSKDAIGDDVIETFLKPFHVGPVR